MTDYNEYKYWGFISYSSKDKKWGSWLHKRLENYPIPSEFQGTEIFDGVILGKNLRPIFRDRDELSGSANLGPAIEKALKGSRYLIVLCSKNSAKSEWVNKEIEDFCVMGGEKRILALILDGVPNATSMDGTPDSEECFPTALRYPLEPLAGDLRKEGDGKERGFLKVLAGLSQLDFDVLYRRHERALQRKRMILFSFATIIIAMLSGLTLFALQQKSVAEKQTEIAVVAKKDAEESRDIAVAQREIAEEQKVIAKKRLADSYFKTGNEKLEQDNDLDGMKDLITCLKIDPSHAKAERRYKNHLLSQKYAVPLAVPFQLKDEAKLIGYIDGRVIVAEGNKIRFYIIDSREIKEQGHPIDVNCDIIKGGVYHEKSGILAIWHETKKRPGRLSLLRLNNDIWEEFVNEPVGAYKKLYFDKSGEFLFLDAVHDLFLYRVKEDHIVELFNHRKKMLADWSHGYEQFSFSGDSKWGLFLVQGKLTALNLDSGDTYGTSFKIHGLNRAAIYWSGQSEYLLIGTRKGLQRIKIEQHSEGLSFIDKGLIEDDLEIYLGRKKQDRYTCIWQPMLDNLLFYSSMSQQGCIVNMNLVNESVVKLSEIVQFSTKSNLNEYSSTYLSADNEFLSLGSVDIDSVIFLQSMNIQKVPFHVNDSYSVKQFRWGHRGEFAIIDHLGTLRVLQMNSLYLGEIKSTSEGLRAYRQSYSSSTKTYFPKSYGSMSAVAFSLNDNKERILTDNSTGTLYTEVKDASCIGNGDYYVVIYYDQKSGGYGDTPTVLYKTGEWDKPVKVLRHGQTSKIVILEPNHDVFGLSYDWGKKVDLLDLNFELVCTVEPHKELYSGQSISIDNKKEKIVWAKKSREIGIGRIVDGEIELEYSIDVEADVEDLFISSDGQYWGAILNNDFVLIWEWGNEKFLIKKKYKSLNGPLYIDSSRKEYFLRDWPYIISYDLFSGDITAKFEASKELMNYRYDEAKQSISWHSQDVGFGNGNLLSALILYFNGAKRSLQASLPDKYSIDSLLGMGEVLTDHQWDEEKLLMTKGISGIDSYDFLDIYQLHQEGGHVVSTFDEEPTNNGYPFDLNSYSLSELNWIDLTPNYQINHPFIIARKSYILGSGWMKRTETAKRIVGKLPAPSKDMPSNQLLLQAFSYKNVEENDLYKVCIELLKLRELSEKQQEEFKSLTKDSL
ncbi:MAG: toll/interleukin-1 receptor domain-containing protein [Lentisphaeria bacterium]|nr:toll/interleukin-1 receptor domain-containing protein [Lentisphaeria bacterium]